MAQHISIRHGYHFITNKLTNKLMASVQKRERIKGVVLQAKVCVNGQRVSSTFDRESDATRWREDVETVLRDDGYIGEAEPGDLLFDSVLMRYLVEVSSTKAKNTARRDTFSGERRLEHFKSNLNP